jgi:hypothetical protein
MKFEDMNTGRNFCDFCVRLFIFSRLSQYFPGVRHD